MEGNRPGGGDLMVANPVLVSNPLPFLQMEERHGDGQATEALFLTFNVDLGFLEARALGVCQAAGARVSVVADASVWNPDHRAVRYAGRAYHAGLIALAGAFHPKVVLLVGHRRAVLAIGSGNLTLGGWQYNAELWSVFTGDADTVPGVFAQAAAFLTGLRDFAADPLTVSALVRAAAALDELRGHSVVIDTGHRLVSSLSEPILDQLPTGPVEELLLSAPFHDPDCAAAEALVTRLRPRRVRLSVQPGWTVINQPALDRFISTCPVPIELVRDAENRDSEGRYRHGKIIEWVSDGQRFALTGSPNLSRAALMLTPTLHGNVEVGVIAPITHSLFPAGEVLTIADVPTHVIPSGDSTDEVSDSGALPLLLAAIRTPEGLTLTLASPPNSRLHIQCSLLQDSPDLWQDLGPVPAQETTFALHSTPPAGSRIRLISDEPTDLPPPSVGSIVLVTDPDAVRRRRGLRSTSRTSNASVRDVFGSDLSVLQALEVDLSQLASDAAATRTPRPSRGDDPEHGDAERARWSDTDIDPWLWEQEVTTACHGAGLAAFALGLPAIGVESEVALPWIDRLTDDRDTGLDSDTAEGTDEDAATGGDEQPDAESQAEAPDHERDDDAHKKARQRWCNRAVNLLPSLPLRSRLVVLHLTLVFWSAHNWPDADLAPLRLIDRALRSMEAPAGSEEMEQRVAGATAVALTMLHDRIDYASNNEGHLIYTRLGTDIAYLATAATEELIQWYSRFVTNPAGFPMSVEHIEETVHRLIDDDPLSEPVSLMQSEGFAVNRPTPRTIEITGDFTNCEAAALRALAQVEDLDPVGVWAVNPRGEWALLAWRRPDLVRVTPLARGFRWRHQRLDGPMGPAALFAQRYQSEGLRGERKHGPQNLPFPEAVELLDALGVTNPPTPPSLATK